MAYRFNLDGQPVALDIRHRVPRLGLVIDDVIADVTEVPAEGAAFELVVDGRVRRGWRCLVGQDIHVRLDGRSYVVRRTDLDFAEGGGGAGGNEIRSDMPGTTIALHVAVGDAVEEGQRLLTIESMKLQMTIAAHRAGRIAALHVEANATFERGAVLVSLAPVEGE
jgi:3-methylcrotonyl-CoA carboxylase alpha subunit